MRRSIDTLRDEVGFDCFDASDEFVWIAFNSGIEKDLKEFVST